MTAPTAIRKTNPAMLAIFWIYVLVPLAWGVTNTLLKAIDLFK